MRSLRGSISPRRTKIRYTADRDGSGVTPRRSSSCNNRCGPHFGWAFGADLPVRPRPAAWAVHLPVRDGPEWAPPDVYVPAEMTQTVQHRVAAREQVEAVLAEISAINLELLARRELD
jgi:hypothetical protein